MRETLYAYVSRGLLRTCAAPGDPRRRLYDRSDIDLLVERCGRGWARREIAAATIDFGEPMLASRITVIVAGSLRYRGQDAVRLAEEALVLRRVAEATANRRDGRAGRRCRASATGFIRAAIRRQRR